MFTVLACADMFGSKVNLELTFPALPTIGELTRRAEEVFTSEMHAIRPAGAQVPAEGIRINRLQVYDDVMLKWVDLISSAQLHEYDQVYIFQPQSLWHVDTQQDLPAPRPPTAGGPGPAAAAPAYATPAAPASSLGQASVHRGFPPEMNSAPSQPMHAGAGERPDVALDVKVRAIFDEMDVGRKGYIDYNDIERGFRERGLDLSNNTLGELFYKADLNRDGHVTRDEFQNFSLIYPNTTECLYFKGVPTPEEAAIQGQIQQLQNHMAENQAREQQNLKEIDSLEASTAALQQDLQRLQAQAAEAAKRKVTLDADERELIEEEVKMERQHDQLRLSKARFEEAQAKFNRGSQAKGSPRRAHDVVL
eukprot:TRINITY_DN3549_c0_g1_i1.p1 TRINITY_DN3549_c0_g1~~TRINITY_DN3549_c0_g1_i1.p1  ORF type:complete len:364 (+),score=161.09 TRINITY_DN3549_c0_g1_i1:60-1151(+)